MGDFRKKNIHICSMNEDKRKPGEKVSPKDKEKALKMYIHWNMDKGEIASKIGVTPQTISEWAKKYDWESLKEAAAMNHVQIYKLLGDQGALILAGEKPNVELDDLKKVIDMMQKVKPKVNIETASPILLELMSYAEKSGYKEGDLRKIKGLLTNFMLTLADV